MAFTGDEAPCLLSASAARDRLVWQAPEHPCSTSVAPGPGLMP